MKLEFSGQMFENTQILNMKIHRVEVSCSMWEDGQTDGQTDMMKSIVSFRNFVNMPKK